MPGNVFTKNTCGSCESGFKCDSTGQCVACLPNCNNKMCGSDGCGGTCGECPAAQYCAGLIVPSKCQPAFTCQGHCFKTWFTSAGLPCNCNNPDFDGLPAGPDAAGCK
ncbi:MAG: hypothetical protein EXR79_06905 [Myxococcales bacterium]|nr:hypothetical protein [Myxococcales bacterium]